MWFVLLGLLGAASFARESPESAKPTVTDIIVRDKHGHIVQGLKPNEVQITDNGDRAKIASLRHFEQGKGKTDLALVFLVLEDTSDSSLSTAQLAISEYQKHFRQSNLILSLWTAHDRVRLVQDFTNDPAVLEAALRAAGRRKASKAESPGQSGAPAQARKVLVSSIERTSSDLIKNQHVRPFVAALFAIARESSSIKERKTVIYFSDGVSLGSLNDDQLKLISGEANSSRVSFYAINTGAVSEKTLDDASHLLMDSMGLSITRVADKAYDLGVRNNKEAVGIRGEKSPTPQSKRLAEQTGGSYISSSGPLRKSFRSAFEDATSYYEVSFVPARNRGDVQYHSISVSVPHMNKVNARAGYFPRAGVAEFGSAPYEIPMAEALSSPDRHETIWFSVDARRAASSDSLVPVKLLVHVPLSGLMAQESDSTRRFQMRVAYLAVVKTPDGKATIRTVTQNVLLEGSLENLGNARKNVYTFAPSLSLTPGNYMADVAISDGNGHRISTKTIYFAAAKDMPLEEEPFPNGAISALEESDIKNSGLRETESEQDDSWHPLSIPNAPRPSEPELEAMLAGARQHANDYKRMLPNFVCLMTTRRLINPSPRGAWKLKDTYSNLLGYVDGREKTVLLEINGVHAGNDESIPDGASVTGEFGELLGMPFSEKVQTSGTWQAAAEIAGTSTQIFQFDVKRKNSEFQVVAQQHQSILAAYRALLYVDSNTFAVRRISVEAQDLPADFPVQESRVTVDYDYVSLSGQDYLLPSHATLLVKQRGKPTRRNEIRFQDYRRYGAQSSLTINK
jgi:VWFA-related protein